MEKGITERGFAIIRGRDLYGEPFSIQDSSLVEIDAVWIGADNGNRAHIDVEMARELVQALNRFIDSGSVA